MDNSAILNSTTLLGIQDTVSGALHDRAATQFHDIGLHLIKNDVGEVGF